jgi:hypothetical protein
LNETQSRTKAARVAVAAAFLMLLLFAVLVAGCSSDTGQTTSIPQPVTTSSAGVSTTTTAPVVFTDLDRELVKTSRAQNALSIALQSQNAADDDPRMAVVYGLHARAQAIGCLQMLKKGDQASLGIADGVMLDIYHQLNLARDIATGSTADTTAAARTIADKIGAPSDHVDEATDLLDQFIKALAPLLDEAAALTPSPSTT